MTDAFSTYHPVVNSLYFTLLLFSMFFMHPLCLAISLVCAFSYNVYLKGKKAVRFSVIYMLPMLIATALINPTFNHEGGTILHTTRWQPLDVGIHHLWHRRRDDVHHRDFLVFLLQCRDDIR